MYNFKVGVVTHVCDSSTQVAETGTLQVQGQPELQSNTLSLSPPPALTPQVKGNHKQ